MPDEIEIIIDETGEERRLGSWENPDDFVCAFPTFETTFEMWDDQQIRRVITDPNRVPRRKIFGPSWIQNQRSHGSCNGYATAGALSRARYLRGIQDKLILSGAFVYSLINGGRDQGSALQAGLKVVETHGAPPESMVPWNMIYPNQQPAGAKAAALKHRGLVCYAASTMQGLRTGLAKGFVAIVAVHAGGAYQQLNSQGIAGVSSGRGNHATHVDDLAIVGGTEVFDQVNSWGLGYGQSGRSYLTKDHFAQTFGTHTFWLLASTEEAD
jgi:hypothetical protein